MKAAYKYQAEDVDELSFEVGEVVQVIEYEDPEEQVTFNINNRGRRGHWTVNNTRTQIFISIFVIGCLLNFREFLLYLDIEKHAYRSSTESSSSTLFFLIN